MLHTHTSHTDVWAVAIFVHVFAADGVGVCAVCWWLHGTEAACVVLCGIVLSFPIGIAYITQAHCTCVSVCVSVRLSDRGVFYYFFTAPGQRQGPAWHCQGV